MTTDKYPVNEHDAYHAHLYFDENSLEFATQILSRVQPELGLVIGRIHQKLVGPHPEWSCQIVFKKHDFNRVVPWLDLNRKGLTVLLHALTGDDLLDHTNYAYWLGSSAELNLEIFGG